MKALLLHPVAVFALGVLTALTIPQTTGAGVKPHMIEAAELGVVQNGVFRPLTHVMTRIGTDETRGEPFTADQDQVHLTGLMDGTPFRISGQFSR